MNPTFKKQDLKEAKALVEQHLKITNKILKQHKTLELELELQTQD